MLLHRSRPVRHALMSSASAPGLSRYSLCDSNLETHHREESRMPHRLYRIAASRFHDLRPRSSAGSRWLPPRRETQSPPLYLCIGLALRGFPRRVRSPLHWRTASGAPIGTQAHHSPRAYDPCLTCAAPGPVPAIPVVTRIARLQYPGAHSARLPSSALGLAECDGRVRATSTGVAPDHPEAS